MGFQPENMLERSLMKAADDPAHRAQFYRDLVESNVFIIQHGPLPEKTRKRTVLKEGYELSLQSMDLGGKSYLPIFSSLPRLEAVLRGEAGYIALNALELLEITKGADLFLNPGSDYGKEFSKEEIASIIDGSIWLPKDLFEVEKDTEILIGQPANFPTELVDILVRVFKRLKQVRRAYLAHYHNPERDEKPHTLVAIEVAGAWDPVVAEAGIATKHLQIPDPPVDFMQIMGRRGVEDYFLHQCKPFYRRKTLGLF
jgi:hypothetical protein